MDILGLLKNNNAKSGGVAKDRLKLVLVHDRVGCSYTVLEMLKADILNVISEYMEIDDEELDIRLILRKRREKFRCCMPIFP